MLHPKINFYESSRVLVEKFLHLVGMNTDLIQYTSETPYNPLPFSKNRFNYKQKYLQKII